MAIVICPSCGGKVSSTRTTCMHCGYEFTAKKTCPECEETIDYNVRECPICGYEFNDVPITVDGNNTAYKSIDGVLYSKDGKTLIQYPAGKTATVFTIPNSVTSIGEYAFEYCDKLTSVTFGNSVTSVGKYAFYCDNLICITVDSNNIAYKSIDGVLYSKDGKTLICYPAGKKATTFTIPNSVTSIGDRAFCSCDKLTSVTFGNSVTSIGTNAFLRCTNLTSITIPNSVISIGDRAFSDCDNLTSITIPNSVTSIGDSAFCSCDKLTSVTFGNSVTSIGTNAFFRCTNLTSITIPNSVISIGDRAFSDCDNLTSITIPNSVTSIGANAFYSCVNLTNVTIGNSVTSIGDKAFYGCLKLVEVINKSPYITVTEGSNSNGYLGCYALSVSNCDDGYVSKVSTDSIGFVTYTNGNKILLNYVGTNTNITIPSDITEINSSAFRNCNNLTSVTIPNSVTSIGWYAFSRCDNLTSVTIGNGVTSISSYAFYYCRYLRSITYKGTKSEWYSISKVYNWNEDMPATYVTCTDGTVSI